MNQKINLKMIIIFSFQEENGIQIMSTSIWSVSIALNQPEYVFSKAAFLELKTGPENKFSWSVDLLLTLPCILHPLFFSGSVAGYCINIGLRKKKWYCIFYYLMVGAVVVSIVPLLHWFWISGLHFSMLHLVDAIT